MSCRTVCGRSIGAIAPRSATTRRAPPSNTTWCGSSIPRSASSTSRSRPGAPKRSPGARAWLACLLAVQIVSYAGHVENRVLRAKGADLHLVRVGHDADVARAALADHQVAGGG